MSGTKRKSMGGFSVRHLRGGKKQPNRQLEVMQQALVADQRTPPQPKGQQGPPHREGDGRSCVISTAPRPASLAETLPLLGGHGHEPQTGNSDMPAGVYLYGRGNVVLATSIVPPVEGSAACAHRVRRCRNGERMKWSMRNHSPLSRAISRLRRSRYQELMRVLDELEWHRWFAWYPVVVARDGGLADWAWLNSSNGKRAGADPRANGYVAIGRSRPLTS